MGADLIVADDGGVDEEAEHAGAQEVPEADGHQEIESPAMALNDRFIAAGHLDEVPGVERDQGQGYDFKRRKDS